MLRELWVSQQVPGHLGCESLGFVWLQVPGGPGYHWALCGMSYSIDWLAAVGRGVVSYELGMKELLRHVDGGIAPAP